MTQHIPESTLDLGIEGHAFYERLDENMVYGAQPSPLGKAELLSRLEHQDKGIPVPALPCSVIGGKSYQPL